MAAYSALMLMYKAHVPFKPLGADEQRHHRHSSFSICTDPALPEPVGSWTRSICYWNFGDEQEKSQKISEKTEIHRNAGSCQAVL